MMNKKIKYANTANAGQFLKDKNIKELTFGFTRVSSIIE